MEIVPTVELVVDVAPIVGLCMDVVPAVGLGMGIVLIGGCFASSAPGTGAIAGTIGPFGLGRVPLA